jgi:hypothetical protein
MTTRRQSPPAGPDLPPPPGLQDLPGRVLDVVHTAACRVGARPSSFNLTLFGPRPTLTMRLERGGPRTEDLARAVFAHLGVTDPEVHDPGPDYSHATVYGRLAALEATIEIVIDRACLLTAAPADPADLIAEVDTRRRAAHTPAGRT